MFQIKRFAVEQLTQGCVTDQATPSFSFVTESDRPGASLRAAHLTVNGWHTDCASRLDQRYGGAPLTPFTAYEAELIAEDDQGSTASASLSFETGRMGTPWQASWITDGSYRFTEKRVSPVPMTFRKSFRLRGKVNAARIYATAMGIYELALNGEKVGEEYFAPGFTAYRKRLQYQTYDVTAQLKDGNTLMAVVSGGWAVGSFIYSRINRFAADRQALLLELRITYEDGSVQVIGTDDTWQVTREGAYRMADLYDGETYDATVDMNAAPWYNASIEKLRVSPEIIASDGLPVKARETLIPQSVRKTGDGLIYDFGQNFAGVIQLKIQGRKGQKITVTHAEILNPDGSLNTAFLRSAKATATYICRDGMQEYSPRLTYMGFRYACVSGVEEKDVTVTARALYSDLEQTGTFACSSEALNQLQSNIIWSSKSNFVDIPTDCPQRDERMGWTGDIALFSPVACYNFHMRRFLDKWLADVRAEQLPTGGLPNTVPANGFGFPTTMPTMAIDFWGDACILVPWAEYQARGDVRVLQDCYPMMRKYVNACRFWAGIWGVGDYRYIWHTPAMLHFGDWVAPGVPKMSQWQGRSKWTATASLCNTSAMLARIARILGKEDDAKKYQALSDRVAKAYRNVFTDGSGKMKNEFQTAYVLPIAYRMLPPQELQAAADNLAAMVEKNDYCIGTGFPGTPYILFALADNGHADTAFRMLMNTKCPSWLYQVKMGATTVWERWDGLDENGRCPISDDGTDMMVSYNHYAFGAVGDFLYRRVAGIEAVEPGYKRFRVQPLIGGGLTHASAGTETPYGTVASAWEIEGDAFRLEVTVPMDTACQVILPDGTCHDVTSGVHRFTCPMNK